MTPWQEYFEWWDDGSVVIGLDCTVRCRSCRGEAARQLTRTYVWSKTNSLVSGGNRFLFQFYSLQKQCTRGRIIVRRARYSAGGLLFIGRARARRYSNGDLLFFRRARRKKAIMALVESNHGGVNQFIEDHRNASFCLFRKQKQIWTGGKQTKSKQSVLRFVGSSLLYRYND